MESIRDNTITSMRAVTSHFVFLALWPGMFPSFATGPDIAKADREERESQAAKLELGLPTANESIFGNRPEAFYMGVDRDGKRLWEGGKFGFVRSPLEWPGGTVHTQFHEGIDIAPVKPRAGGLPDDEVKAISAGTVMIAETQGRTQYGNQVVCRHECPGGPVFSRYAHLSSVNVAPGEKVARGGKLGVMGYSGGALTAERAHLHLEINLMLNEAFERSWLPPGRAPEGEARYQRANFAGVDAAALFAALRTYPSLTFQEFVRNHEPYFIVATASDGPVDLLKRHPWLSDGKPAARGWKVGFTEWGLPVRFEAIDAPPAEPRVVWVRPFEGKHAWRTGGLLSGTGETASLNSSGLALLQIIFGRRP